MWSLKLTKDNSWSLEQSGSPSAEYIVSFNYLAINQNLVSTMISILGLTMLLLYELLLIFFIRGSQNI